MDQGLSLDDLAQVLEELHDVSPQWYNIGLQLKLSPDTMDKIKREESDSNDQLREMLKVWLKRVEPKPTREALVQALRSRSVGRDQEANRLEKKYCKGKAVSKTPSDAPMRANQQQPKGKVDPVIPKQQPQAVNSETALATSAQPQKSTEDAKKTTKRVSTSTNHIENESTMPVQKGLKHHHQAVPEGQESRDSSSSLKRASTSTGSEEPSSKKPKEDDIREEELPSEILYQSCQDHVFKCKECRERLLKDCSDRQNKIPCTNVRSGCDWKGKSTEERDAHITICPKQNISCPFDEEFKCQYKQFPRDKLIEHLQNHITTLHTQVITCQRQTPPVTFKIQAFRNSIDNIQPINGVVKQFTFPFYTHEEGYLYRLCITVKANEVGTKYLELSIEHMPGCYDDRILWPSRRAKVIGKIIHPTKADDHYPFTFKDLIYRCPNPGSDPKQIGRPHSVDIDNIHWSSYVSQSGEFQIEISKVDIPDMTL